MIFCYSCTEIIDVDLNTADARYVVEATVSQKNASVILSKTTSYLNPKNIPYVNGAEVTIAFNDTIFTLKEDSVGHYSITYDFPSETMYSLAVAIGSTFITAESYMPKPLLWDSVTVDYSSLSDWYTPSDSLSNLFDIYAYITDPKGTANYYKLRSYKNDTLVSSNVTCDELFDGQSIRVATYIDEYKETDTLKLFLESIDMAAYNYYNTLAMSNSSSGFFSAPDNPESNLVGDALGRFYAYSVDSVLVKFNGKATFYSWK